MPPPNSPDLPADPSTSNPPGQRAAEPDVSGPAQPIGELAGRPDFPKCALGLHVEIQGFTGVVTEIIGQSIKVRAHEGITQRFNANRLRTLHAPPARPEPVAERPGPDGLQTGAPSGQLDAKPASPGRVYITAPDFSASARAIRSYAAHPGFPQSSYGKHVDIAGYTGVVVEILQGSIKVQSPAGITRSYNAAVLQKLYGTL